MSETSSPLPAMMPAESATRRRRADHLFYSIFSYLILASVFFGFSRTYYLKEFFDSPPLAPIFHVHAVVFTAWLLLFVTQTSLISAGRVRIHQWLGYGGVFLAAAMVAVGFAATIASSKSGHSQNKFAQTPVEALFANAGDLVVFLAFFIPAVLLRHRPEAHKRLMILATTAGLLPAAIARWPILHRDPKQIIPVIGLFLLIGPIYDLVSRRRVHLAYILGLIFFVLTPPPARVALARTTAGQRIGNWILR
jgi:hypothetical protein